MGGTTESPLHLSKSWWESTWLEPDLWTKMIRNESFYGDRDKKLNKDPSFDLVDGAASYEHHGSEMQFWREIVTQVNFIYICSDQI